MACLIAEMYGQAVCEMDMEKQGGDPARHYAKMCVVTPNRLFLDIFTE
jgi:hypothetical protein